MFRNVRVCLVDIRFLTSALSPADLTVAQALMERSWAGTMHGLTLTSQTLGFLQSGLRPSHPPNHMVKKTRLKSLSHNERSVC